MRSHSLPNLMFVLCVFGLLPACFAHAEEVDSAVQSIFQEHCWKCHGEKKTSGRLDLRTLESMLRGGKRGPAIVPGNVADSRLLQLVRPGTKPHMPPGKKQLPPEDIARLEQWIASVPVDVAASLPDENVDRPAAGHVEDPAVATPKIVVPVGVDPTLAIDLFVAARWNERSVSPNERCNDATFARRAYLDFTGRIPTIAELNDFCGDSDSDKRRQLIDDLLSREHFASHMADIFDAVLLGRRGERSIQERIKHGWRNYLESAFADNRPWNQMAREMVLARADEASDVRAGWYLYERKENYQEIAEAVSPNFFGIQIECAQCHDHPLAAEIEQRHYWGLVSFFNRGKNKRTDRGPRVVESAIGGFQKFTDLGGEAYDASLTYFASATIEEPRPENGAEEKDSDENYLTELAASHAGEPRVPRFSRRQQFADEVLSSHPLLAKAFVNRIWALLMGRGIVHPVDRMDSTNPPSHPEMLQWLASDFRDNGFDVQRLLRSIANSQAYQLKSGRLDSQSSETLPSDFAYALDKPLTAESYLNSICLALTDQPCTNASLMNQFRRDFPDVFPEEPTATLSQALLMTNSPEVYGLFHSEAAATVDQMLNLPDAKTQVEFAFWKLYGRQPDADELTTTTQYLAQRKGSRDAIGQLLWAMIGSAEFRVNH